MALDGKPLNERNIYDPRTVSALFDEMSRTYGVVNLISSFGFTLVWRKVCASKLAPRASGLVVDLMTGMGELLPHLVKRLPSIERIEAIDFSREMCEGARRQADRLSVQTKIIENDIFACNLKENSADCVVSTFGLKTFSREQQRELADLVAKILKRGGQFSFIEISIPPNPCLRAIYCFYLNCIIPWVGKLCLGNPENYRFLGVYTQRFGNSRFFFELLQARGLEVQYFTHFFGCASGVYGRKRPEALIGKT